MPSEAHPDHHLSVSAAGSARQPWTNGWEMPFHFK